MSSVPFVKANACGNDFLIIRASDAPGDRNAFTRTVCQRNNGVGADGVEWVLEASDADLRIRLVNADGTDAEISGNGTRCVAAWYCSEYKQDVVRVQTDAGLKTCQLIAQEGNTFGFRTAMGTPQVSEYLAVGLTYGEVKGTPVSMGNPHFVMFVSQFEPGWQEIASEIAAHRAFPDGTNVELVCVRNPGNLEVRIWERGVGETRSSGTGSCASAIAAIHTGQARSPVLVNSLGGAQTVEWKGEVFLTGPATLVCRGEIFV